MDTGGGDDIHSICPEFEIADAGVLRQHRVGQMGRIEVEVESVTTSSKDRVSVAEIGKLLDEGLVSCKLIEVHHDQIARDSSTDNAKVLEVAPSYPALDLCRIRPLGLIGFPLRERGTFASEWEYAHPLRVISLGSDRSDRCESRMDDVGQAARDDLVYGGLS